MSKEFQTVPEPPPAQTSHARYAARAAASLGWSWRSLDGADAYLFEVSDGARRAVLAAGSASPYALNRASAYSLARDKAFATAALESAGLATIPSRLFFITDRHVGQRAPGRELEDARAYVAAAQSPLFAKPNAGARGDFAELIASPEGFEDYVARAAFRHDAILLQPLIEGREYRIGVLEGAPLFSYAKRPPMLVGDGVSSLAALYERHLSDLGDLSVAQPPLSAARFIDAAGAARGPDETPRADEKLRIRGRANRAGGGGAEDFTDVPPAPLAAIAVACARALGLGMAGVDVFDVSPARDLSALIVIEVNANPAFETLEELGRFDLIEQIWIANLTAALG